MSDPTRPEVGLQSPLPGVDPISMPVAHAPVRTREDIAAAAGASGAQAGNDRAVIQLGHTPPATYGETRPVGRAALPANVLGLIAHAAEHAWRRTGQVIMTLKIVRGLRAQPAP
jgi:hypothetical protein